MKIPLCRHHFNGEEPIIDLFFLVFFTSEANIQEMLEAHAFVTLPSFLEGFALGHSDAVAGMTP